MTKEDFLILALLDERARILNLARQLPALDAAIKALEDENEAIPQTPSARPEGRILDQTTPARPRDDHP